MSKSLRNMAFAVLATFLVIALLTPPTEAQGNCPGGAITVTTANWTTIFNQYGPGTSYCFSPGTYSGFSIVPQTGDKFYSSTLQGAVLSGNGNTRQAFRGITRNTVSGDPGYLTGTEPFQVQNVTIDGFRFVHYVNTQVWAGQFPNEAAVSAHTGWVIEDNVFEGSQNQPMSAAIIIAQANWACSYNVTIRNNVIKNMGYVAILGNIITGLIEGNTIQNNGWGAPSEVDGAVDRYNTIEWNGQFKVTNNQVSSWTGQAFNCPTFNPGPIINNNIIERNRGEAGWNDVNVTNAIWQNNIVRGNSGGGLQTEISNGTVFRNNTVYCNNWEYTGRTWEKGEIVNWNTLNMTVENNWIRACGQGETYQAMGTTFTYNVRQSGGGFVGGTAISITDADDRQTMSIVVRNNTIILAAGAFRAVNMDQFRNPALPARGIPATFTGNTYYVTTSGRVIYENLAGATNFAGWQGKGYDTGGSETTATPPTQPAGGGSFSTPTPGGPTNTPAPTFTPTATQPSSGCYLGVCASVPGRVELENFDYGVNGVAYADASPGNLFNTYRLDVDADIKTVSATNYALGFGETGDYTNYTVNVTASGVYNVTFVMASADATGAANSTVTATLVGGSTTVTLGGGPINVPVVQAWDTWSTVTLQNVIINAGTYRLNFLVNRSYVDADYIDFALVSGVTATATATQTPSPTFTPSATFTPSPTAVPPTVVPSFTPSPTYSYALDVLNAVATQGAVLEAMATYDASVSNANQAVITAQANVSSALATQRVGRATQSWAQGVVSRAVQTAAAPPPR